MNIIKNSLTGLARGTYHLARGTYLLARGTYLLARGTYRLALIASLSMVAVGCAEDEGMVFSDIARIQMGSADDYTFSFVWSSADVQRQTIYLPISVIGGPTDGDRHVEVEQVEEYDVVYTKDRLNYVVDSTLTPRTDQAVAGTHYVTFNSSEYASLLTVPAGRVQSSIGIILLRHPSLATQKVRLRVRLKSNADFGPGEHKYQERTIVISDMLERPSAWTTESWNTLYRSFGDYSRTKHLFMMQVVGDKVDDAWFARAQDASFRNYWKMKFVEALALYNADPANIAAGLAPMRVDEADPNSALISFPSELN